MRDPLSTEPDLKAKSPQWSHPLPAWLPFAGGVLFTMVIAALGYALADAPVFDRVGAMVCAILISVVYRQFLGYPMAIRSGVQFSARSLLRFAIVLFGLKLNVDIILHQGLLLLLRDLGTIAFAITAVVLIGRWLKADASLTFLLGIGTGVCGAAAIAAVSPIVQAHEDDTAIGAGIIALAGTFFAVAYTLLRPMLPLSPLSYGVWAGVSLHEIAHVAAAAAPAGQGALAIALLAKLGRVLLLVPLSFLLTYWMRRKGAKDHHAKVEFPWFLVGFIAMSLVGTYAPLPAALLAALSNIGSFLLAAAMVGLGLNVSFQALRTKALRPLIAMLIASVLLSAFTYLTIV